MATPKDNTEIVRMLRDVKETIWKSVTPAKNINESFNEYLSRITGSSLMQPNIATRLNFSILDESKTFSESSAFEDYKTPESLKRKLMNTEAELQASKAKVKERESLISVMEPVNKKLCVSLENKLEQCRKQNELDCQKIEDLKQKLRWSQKETTSAKNKILEVERQRKIDKNKFEKQILNLQQECSNLKVEIANLKSEKTEAVRKFNVELGRLELKVSMLAEERESSQEYIKTLKRQNDELSKKAALFSTLEKELKEAKEKIKTLENKIEADIDAALIVSARQSDLKLLSKLQKENRILKEEINKCKENNVLLYQEKILSLNEKLGQLEKKNVTYAKLQVENEQLKSKIAQWEQLCDDKSADFKSPTAFSRRLSQYQKNEAMLTNKLSQISNHCETLEKQKNELEESVRSLNRRLQQYQLNFPCQESLIKRLQRKNNFLTKERDNCRKLLDSYVSETTVSGVALNADQISHLEDMNMEYKKALEKCEREIDNLNEKVRTLSESSETDTLVSEIKKLRDENSLNLMRVQDLEKEKESLKAKCTEQSELQDKNSWGGKILHLQFNPLDNANKRYLETFQKLQEENDHLKKRMKILEEEGIEATDVTAKVQQKLIHEGADSTLQSLREQLAAAEKQQQFIIESALIKATEFREAVYQLTGYRIDVPTAERYKLSHLYADSRDDYLLFQVNSEGIQLIETEYSKQLTDRLQLYLHQHDSFPAFLASITMDLFSQQTYMLNQ